MKKIFTGFLLLALSTVFAQDVRQLQFTDEVSMIQDVRYGQRILFRSRAAFFKLKTTSPRYQEIHDALRDSEEKKKSISVIADPYSMELLDLAK